MTDYLLLIYRDEQAAGTAADGEVSSPYREFMQRRADALRGGAALEPSSTATSVRDDGRGGWTVTDGPFAESKEVLGRLLRHPGR